MKQIIPQVARKKCAHYLVIVAIILDLFFDRCFKAISHFKPQHIIVI